MSKQLKKSIAIIATTSLVALPVVAKPMMQKITAYLNPAIEYVVDGKEVLEDTQTISYKDKNYVSVADLSKALGKEVRVEGNKVIISTPQTPEITDKVTIAQATIKEINLESNQVTVLPEGLKNQRENYVTLNIGKETLIRHELNKKAYTINDLEKEMIVKVVHKSMMTTSIPPQTPALEIVVLANQGELDDSVIPPTVEVPKTDELEDAVIKEINHSQKYLIVICEGKTYKVPFTNKTEVDFDDDHKKPNVNSLKVGQKVDIELKKGVAVEIDVED